MKKYTVKPLRLFKFRSVFATTAIAVVSLCLVLCTLFSVLFTYMLLGNVEETRRRDSQSYIETVADSTDFLLENVNQTLTQISLYREFYSLCIKKQVDEGIYNKMMISLSLISDNHALIQSAVIYVSALDEVVTSNYHHSQVDDSDYADMIHAYLGGTVQQIPLETMGRTSHLFYYNGRLILARNAPLDDERGLATIFCVLDSSVLYRTMHEGNNLWVFDAYGQPLFEQEIAYPEEVTSISSQMQSEQHTVEKMGKGSLLMTVSEKTGWSYVAYLENSVSATQMNGVLHLLIPAVLAILVCASSGSVLIARVLYRPFQTLLESMEERGLFPTEEDSFKNEFTYLTGTFAEQAKRQEKLLSVMSDVSYDVISRLFRNIIAGAQLSYQDVNKILASANSPLSANALYVTCVLHHCGEKAWDPAERSEMKGELARMLPEFQQTRHVLTHVLTEDNDLVIVLAFQKKKLDLLTVKKTVDDLAKTVSNALRCCHVHYCFLSGELYHSMLDVGLSYRDAMAVLSVAEPERGVTEKEKAPVAEQPQEMVAAPTGLAAKAKHILHYTVTNEPQEAATLYKRVIDDIFEEEGQFDGQLAQCKVLITAIITDILEQPEFQYAPLPENLFAFLPVWEQMNDSELLKENAKLEGDHIISALVSIILKQQNRYIVNAQKYIAEHFADSNLSLTTVSEENSINSSYLSKLFKANLGVYFTDYVNKYRINASCVMLEHTDRAIKEIAQECGFNSVQNYIRVFKKYIGSTPGQYRQQLSKKQS